MAKFNYKKGDYIQGSLFISAHLILKKALRVVMMKNLLLRVIPNLLPQLATSKSRT